MIFIIINIIKGVCGTDNSFLYYAGGIYDNDNCCNTQNHAVLLVGHGADETSGLDYWIIMNRYYYYNIYENIIIVIMIIISWGTMWGVNGLMKIKKRTSNSISELCGLAVNPTIVVGAYIVNGGNDDNLNSNNENDNDIINMIRDWSLWVQYNYEIVAFYAALALFVSSLLLLFYSYCMEFKSNRYRYRYRDIPHTNTTLEHTINPVVSYYQTSPSSSLYQNKMKSSPISTNAIHRA